MVLASDRFRDGELIGDPTEGALVGAAANGGHRADLIGNARDAESFPLRCLQLIATFHKMTSRPQRCDPASSRARRTRCCPRAATVSRRTTQARLRRLRNSGAGTGRAPRLGHSGACGDRCRRRTSPGRLRPPAPTCSSLSPGWSCSHLVGNRRPRLLGPPPPRQCVHATAKARGIMVLMKITVDYAAHCAAAVRRQLCIDGTVLSGARVRRRSNAEHWPSPRHRVIARVTPSTCPPGSTSSGK